MAEQLESQLKLSNTRISALEADIVASRAEVSRLNSIVDSLQRDVNGPHTELLASLQHSAELSQKLSQANADMLKCQDDLLKCQNDFLLTSKKLQDQLQENNRLLTHVNLMEAASVELVTQVQIMEDVMLGLKSSTESKISKLISDIHSAKALMGIVGGRAATAQNEIASSESAAASLRAELDSAVQDRDSLSRDLREYLVLNQSLAHEMQRLSRRVEDLASARAPQSPAAGAPESYPPEPTGSDAGLDGNVTGARLSELLRRQGEALARDVGAMSALVARLESQRESQSAQAVALHSQTDDQLAENKELVRQNQALSAAAAEMVAQMQADAAERAQLGRDVQTLLGQVSAQADELLALHAQLRELQRNTEAEATARQQRIDSLAEDCQRGIEQAQGLTLCVEAGEATILELINEKEALLAQLGGSRARAAETESRLAAECAREREERDALQQRCDALAEEVAREAARGEGLAQEAQALRALGGRETASKEQLAQLVEQLTRHAKGSEEARQELASRHDELVATAQREAEERKGLAGRLEEEAGLRLKWETEVQGLAKKLEAAAAAAATDAADKRRLGQQVEDLLLRNQAELEANAQLGQRAEEALRQCAREAEERRRLAEAVEQLNGVVEQLQAQALGDAEAHKVMQAEKRALQAQVEELGRRHGAERTALHGRLQDANARLALAAEALHGAARKSGDMAVLEQQLAEAAHARDDARARAARAEAAVQQARGGAAALEAQLGQAQQEAAGAALELERARERVQSYERALFDTRQSIALKDARVAELEANAARLSHLLSLRTTAQPASVSSAPPPSARFPAAAAEGGGSAGGGGAGAGGGDARGREYGSAPRSGTSAPPGGGAPAGGRSGMEPVSFDMPAVRVPPIHYESQFL